VGGADSAGSYVAGHSLCRCPQVIDISLSVPGHVSHCNWEGKTSGGMGRQRRRGLEEEVLQGNPWDFAMQLSRTSISLLPSFSVCFCVRW